jgi:SAM-dependent methyltransferase
MMKVANRTVGSILPPRVLSRRYDRIPGRVHADDQMLKSELPQHLAHYVTDAHSAIENVTQSLATVGRSWSDVAALLDLPCGYGRVTRLLVQQMPAARITACDVDRRAVRFCVAEFHATPRITLASVREEPAQFAHSDATGEAINGEKEAVSA